MKSTFLQVQEKVRQEAHVSAVPWWPAIAAVDLLSETAVGFGDRR